VDIFYQVGIQFEDELQKVPD